MGNISGVGCSAGIAVGAGEGAGIEQAASITTSRSGRALSRRMGWYLAGTPAYTLGSKPEMQK
jgi:hypothetical protein